MKISPVLLSIFMLNIIAFTSLKADPLQAMPPHLYEPPQPIKITLSVSKGVTVTLCSSQRFDLDQLRMDRTTQIKYQKPNYLNVLLATFVEGIGGTSNLAAYCLAITPERGGDLISFAVNSNFQFLSEKSSITFLDGQQLLFSEIKPQTFAQLNRKPYETIGEVGLWLQPAHDHQTPDTSSEALFFDSANIAKYLRDIPELGLNLLMIREDNFFKGSWMSNTLSDECSKGPVKVNEQGLSMVLYMFQQTYIYMRRSGQLNHHQQTQAEAIFKCYSGK